MSKHNFQIIQHIQNCPPKCVNYFGPKQQRMLQRIYSSDINLTQSLVARSFIFAPVCKCHFQFQIHLHLHCLNPPWWVIFLSSIQTPGVFHLFALHFVSTVIYTIFTVFLNKQCPALLVPITSLVTNCESQKLFWSIK